MKKRKVLAALMVMVMLIACVPNLSVQAESIGKEAQACKDLGILIGADSSGVTSQYLSTTPTRIQALIIFLRLKGLYSDASQYEGSENFKDASAAGWAKNFMAYAKDNPDLGWQGYPNGTFAPGDKMSGQAFYKVMLEALGYKQNVDFTYVDALKFAESLGLVKKADDIAKLKSFTINDVAKGIYNALNTKPQGSEKKLISEMVEKGMIAPDKAVDAGFELDTKAAKVVSFNVVSNNRIDVEFDQEIVLDKADIEISQLGGSSRLSVLSVESLNKRATIITTEAKPFSAYEVAINTLVPTNNMVIRNFKKKFVAMPKDVVKPTAKHELYGRNEVLVTFSENVSRSTAEDQSNYVIEHNVVIMNAELRPDGKSVLLRTSDMSPSSFYRLNVQNISDLAGNKMDKYTALFEGVQQDTQGPSVISVKSENNSTLSISFNERVDKNTAESTDSYSIDNGLSIVSAKLDEGGKTVVLRTAAQEPSIIYNLTVQNIADAWGNVMYRKDWKFVGDSSKPNASVMVVSNNEVRVTFTKKMEKSSAENIENYMIDKGLEVKGAMLDQSGKVVTIITSDQTVRELYTLTIMQVYDSWGNMTDLYSAKFAGATAVKNELTYTAKSKGNEIIITYNKRVDKETAEDVFNYVLDDSLGYAAKATLDDSGTVVTLLTANHTPGKMYSITVENVTDVMGNQISTDAKVCTKKFAGVSAGGGTDGSGTLSLEAIVTANINTIDLIFSSELSQAELDAIRVRAYVPEGYNYSLPSGAEYYKYFIGDKKTLRIQYKTSTSNNPDIFKPGNIYEVEITGLDRLNSKGGANIKMFAGTSNPNEVPRVLSVNAINSTAVEVAFSEPVKGMSKAQFEIRDGITISDVSVKDLNDVTDKVTLYLSSSTKLSDKEYKLYARSGIKDAAGLNSVASSSGSTVSYVEFDGISEDNEAPVVDTGINVLDSYTLQFGFNEPVKGAAAGSFSIRRVSGTGNVYIANTVLSEDKKTVTLYLNSRYPGLDSNSEYELSMGSSIMDLQGLAVVTENRKLRFNGADGDLEALEIITSYINESNTIITLIPNRELCIDNLTMDDFMLSGAGYYMSSSDRVEYDSKSVRIILNKELTSGETLNIKITESGRSRIKDYNSQKLTTEEVGVEVD